MFAYRKARCWKLTDLTTRCAYMLLESTAGEGEAKSAGVRCTLEAQAHTLALWEGRYILVTGACKNTRVVPVSFIVEVVWSRVRVAASHAPRSVNL